MTDFDETRRRRRNNKVVMQNRPNVNRILFICPDTECNHCCTVEIPEGQRIFHRCKKCGKDMIVA